MISIQFHFFHFSFLRTFVEIFKKVSIEFYNRIEPNNFINYPIFSIFVERRRKSIKKKSSIFFPTKRTNISIELLKFEASIHAGIFLVNIRFPIFRYRNRHLDNGPRLQIIGHVCEIYFSGVGVEGEGAQQNHEAGGGDKLFPGSIMKTHAKRP